VVGFWKLGSGQPSMTWSESVDKALCFGWIDAKVAALEAQGGKIRSQRWS
jgi:uncharacterized protein YdeI (YjbR/CyaY-like superfamily)